MGENIENMKYILDGIEELPNNLEHIRLGLAGNNLGKNKENLYYLGDCIK